MGFLREDLSELLDEPLDEPLEEYDFEEVSAEDFLSLPLPFWFFFGLFFFCFFCTLEAAVAGLVAAAGRFAGFGFLALPPAAFVGGAVVTAGTLAALERVVGAIVAVLLG